MIDWLFDEFHGLLSKYLPNVDAQAVPQNGHGGRKEEGGDGEGKKHRKHRKKSSRHESTFVSFVQRLTNHSYHQRNARCGIVIPT